MRTEGVEKMVEDADSIPAENLGALFQHKDRS